MLTGSANRKVASGLGSPWLAILGKPGLTPAPAGNQNVGISIIVFSPTMKEVTEL
jgi:hypothetical protein